MNNTQKLILIALVFAGLLTLFSISNFALADRNLEIIDYPDAPLELDTPAPGKDTTLPQYMKYLFNFGIGIGGILVFLVFVFAGIKWITSAGNPTSIASAKKMMFGGIAGLALLLLSYIIVITLNPELKTFKEVEEMAPTTGAYITGTLTGIGGEEEDKRLYQGDISGFRENFASKTIEFISDKNELYSIFAYEEGNYQGDAVEIINTGKGSVGDISGKKSIAFFWNKPGVYIYEDTNHQGKRPPKYCFGPINDLDKDYWDNKAQSIRFNNIYGNKYGAVLFTNNDFQKECGYAYKNDVMDLSSPGSKTYIHPIGIDTLSSLNVFRIPDAVEGKVTVYDSINCGGRKKEYTPTEVMVFDDLTKDGCSIGDCLFDKINPDDEEKELHRNIKSIKIEGQFYALLKAKGECPPEPAPDESKIKLPYGAPSGNKCAKRMVKILAEGTDFDIVRGGTGPGSGAKKNPTWPGGPSLVSYHFNCKDICKNRGQDCVGVGLYDVKDTFCRYIIHNVGMDCQMSVNLAWGECDQEFYYGTAFCEELSPIFASWGYFDTGCYCMNK